MHGRPGAGWLLTYIKEQDMTAESGSSGRALRAMQELEIKRIINAPRELVYKACTDEKLLAQWWGPEGFTNPVCAADMSPGGKIHIVMKAPDGTEYPMRGVCYEAVAPERLVLSTTALEDANGVPALEVRNTFSFKDHGGNTELMMHASVVKAAPEAAQAIAGMEQGWNGSLDRLSALLASE